MQVLAETSQVTDAYSTSLDQQNAIETEPDNQLGKELIKSCKAGDKKKLSKLIPTLEKIDQLIAFTERPNSQGDAFTLIHIACHFKQIEIVQLLIRQGADIESKTKLHELTPLQLACSDGTIEIVNYLLNLGCQFNTTRKESGETPLILSIIKGQLDIVTTLLQHGADPNLKLNNGFSPLDVAAQYKRADITKQLLLHGAEANITNESFSQSALIQAIDYDAFDTATLLVSWDPEVKEFRQTDIEFESPLEELLRWLFICYQYNALTYLFSEGLVDHNQKINKHSLLFYAVKLNFLKMVEYLLNNNYNVDERHEHDQTALHIAVRERLFPICELLLAHKASVDVQDEDGYYPLHALHTHTSNLKAWIECLIPRGKSIDSMLDSSGNSPFHDACKYANLKLVEALLPYVASVDHLNGCDNSALFISLAHGDLEISQCLIKSGAHYKILKPKYKASALHVLVNFVNHFIRCEEHKLLDFIDYLIEQECDINAIDSVGHTALSLSTRDPNLTFVAKHLIERKAKVTLPLIEACSPIHIASHNNCGETLKLLLKHRVDLQQKYKGYTCLQLTLTKEECSMDCLKILLNDSRVTENKKALSQALLEAIYFNHFEAVQLLLNAGADINYVDETLASPPLNAALNEGHDEIGMFLIKCPDIDVTRPSQGGFTALQAIAALGKNEILKLILEQLHTREQFQCGTGLLVQNAILENHTETALILLNANPSLAEHIDRDRECICLHVAIKNRLTLVINKLIEVYPEAVHLVDNNDKTALDLATENKLDKKTIALLKKTAMKFPPKHDAMHATPSSKRTQTTFKKKWSFRKKRSQQEARKHEASSSTIETEL
ncbi:hypothetical protein D5018_03615 [Parashewanella curva]|uniref:Uncharacterized protein n=1 Tax=Parashewanella curva TaxID=2338552 RepID=A0A3L8Q0J9_9GAMM|nr:ankyrin repeat domain-containing protein [Parashewanella curva]RLV61095.1 hypothetical protein D5018_03615 [Parashewanella curva]